jgi:hypothetical membrane protein
MRKLLPAALIAIPVLYYFALLAGAATYPGYSHITNYASELGAADAPRPELFNIPIMFAGVTALIAAFLLPGGFLALGGSRLWAILAAVALGMFGASMIMSGMFPMPDDRHGGFGLGLAAPLVPLFMLLAMRSVANARGIQILLTAVFIASVVMLAIMFGVGQLVTRANVGLYQRLNTGVSIPWLAALGAWLWYRVPPPARAD